MNRVSATLALIALLAGGVAAAQSPPASSPQPPPSTMPPTSEDPGAATAPSAPQAAPNSTTDKKAQLKDCITQQRANDPQMSEHDAKKACKAAVNGSPRN